MGRKESGSYLLGKLEKFLSLPLMLQVNELSRGLESLRRRKIPLNARNAEKAKRLLEALEELTDPLSEIKASLIAGLPREKWSNAGSGAAHEESIGC